MEKCCFVDVRKLGQVYEDWPGQLRSFGKNGIILNIRRSSGQSFYILKVSKWAIVAQTKRYNDYKLKCTKTGQHTLPHHFVENILLFSLTSQSQSRFGSVQVCSMVKFLLCVSVGSLNYFYTEFGWKRLPLAVLKLSAKDMNVLVTNLFF